MGAALIPFITTFRTLRLILNPGFLMIFELSDNPSCFCPRISYSSKVSFICVARSYLLMLGALHVYLSPWLALLVCFPLLTLKFLE